MKTIFDNTNTYLTKIKILVRKPMNLMEVCGTHTNAISASGIRHSLPKGLKLLSGPGCPVCVTAQKDIDWVIELARTKQAVITTFGDLMRVPGTESTLEKEKANGSDIRVVYSPLDALSIAEKNKKPVIFIGVGFETTAPTIAGAVKLARQKKINNFFIVPFFKLIPPALRMIVNQPRINVDGFILPGHVSTIIGIEPYQFLSKDYKKPCVITGFEPYDILQGVYLLLEQINNNKPKIELQYTRSVDKQGNKYAQKLLQEIFSIGDAEWRGLGVIKNSGLEFSTTYKQFDAKSKFVLNLPKSKPNDCRCGDVLLGLIIPIQCKLFAKKCTPANPVGPCMVSSEGACAAYYKYERKVKN